jgi:Protein of unknown function (DUF2786)
MMNHESLVDKIKALLNKTVENGCTEAEALAALSKARAMMDAYEVTAEELQLSKVEVAILRGEPSDARDPHKIKWYLGSAVGKFCDCKIWRSSEGFQFCGLASDVEFAMWLLDYLTDFVQAELVWYLTGCLAPRDERKKIVKGFVLGCTGRISDKLVELCRRPAAQRTDNSRALVAIKSTAITEKLRELGITLRQSSGRCRSFSETALEAGRIAGDRASFGRPVSGAAGVLRLK